MLSSVLPESKKNSDISLLGTAVEGHQVTSGTTVAYLAVP